MLVTLPALGDLAGLSWPDLWPSKGRGWTSTGAIFTAATISGCDSNLRPTWIFKLEEENDLPIHFTPYNHEKLEHIKDIIPQKLHLHIHKIYIYSNINPLFSNVYRDMELLSDQNHVFLLQDFGITKCVPIQLNFHYKGIAEKMHKWSNTENFPKCSRNSLDHLIIFCSH